MADEEKIILTLEAEDEASKKVDNLSKSIQNMEKTASGMGSGVSGGVSSIVSSLESGISRINNVTRHYNLAMSGFNRMVTNGIREMGSAVYDFTSDSINNFTKFSEQHAKTLGAMAADYDNTASSQAKFFEDAQKLKEQALQIGTYGINGTGALMDTTEVSQAQTELIKAGVSATEIVDPSSNITRDVLEFAQANDLSTDQAIEFAVTLGNQFGIEKKDWGLMLDKVSHTADMSIIDVADIVQSMKYAGGITSGLDRSLEETLGMISILGDFGLKGSQGGSGIQALMTRLLTGDTTVITQAQAEIAPGNALEKFYEFEKIAKPDGNLLPMADVIEEMDAIMADMTDEEQAWFAKKLFGLYQMKSAYALLNGDEADLNDIIKEIETQSEGTNANKLEQLLESQYGQLTSLNNLWEGIKTDVGDRLSPFVDAIRDELFAFLSNDGNYDINFDNLRSALDESCNLIEEKYGSAIANAVRGIGELAIDFTQIGEQIAPELGSGLLEVFSSAFSGDFFGADGAFADWETMIDDMHLAVDELPEDLQGLGDAVVSTIDWFGKLCALNVASEIAELVSSVLQILTIAGGAMINVAGSVVVNGSAVGGGTGGGTGGKGTGTGGAGSGGASTAGASSVLKGSTTIGSADDVAKALGTTTDDVIATFGKQATYSIDDIAHGLGGSADDIIEAWGGSLDDVIKASAGSIDDVARGTSGLWGSLSKAGKWLGALGTILQVGMSGYEAYNDFSSGDNKGGAEAIGGGVGSLGGAWGGAALGTAIFPGVGTVIGAIIGGLGGDWLGRELTGGAFDMFDNGTTGIGLYDDWRRVQLQNEAAESLTDIIGTELSEFEKALDGIGGYTSQAWKTAFTYGNDYYQYNQMDDKDKEKFREIYVEYKSREYDENSSYADDLARSTAESAKREQETVTALKELGAQMLVINKNNDETSKYYDPKMDTLGQGYYSIWTGTDAQLQEYLANRGQRMVGSDYYDRAKTEGATEDNPYMLEGLGEEIKQGIIDGFGTIKEQQKTSDVNIAPYADLQSYLRAQNQSMTVPKLPSLLNPFGNLNTLDITAGSTNLTGEIQIPELKLPDASNTTADNVTLNASNTNLTGSVTIPNIDAVVRSIMPNGYAVLSDKGKQDLIENHINNQIQIDDTVTMQPQFSVAAPNVNVSVHVDKEERVIKQVSILNPQQGTLLNNWYSRTSSQYGRTTK